ncbi:uncharacterized protein LOC131294513 [Anopheles ziemanni]|uniref:uncharacterized protein LOC131265145 n=1 Tax=Anopheles coustani TaxID=139045 RepID=UPI0026587FE3|nr:uncharacterized protein LOC131265145 [Anopheles coustani]XP_058178542.1 uncharacterized protein LOC131294513 [Anopheles ziemanni]
MSTINVLGTKGRKVFVEHGGRVYSAPQKDIQEMALLNDQNRRSYYARDGDRQEEEMEQKSKNHLPNGDNMSVKSREIYSLSSDSDVESHNGAENRFVPTIVPSCSASKVMTKLKDEVMRLIDESIEKIEQDWAEQMASTKCEEQPPSKAPPNTPAEEKIDHSLPGENTLALHPDGDQGELNHREQNLLVMKSQQFVDSKRRTRMMLLDEIHARIERLKDMETLE